MKQNRQSTVDAIVAIPPISKPDESVNVTVSDITVRRLWMNEYYKEMDIDGILKIEWKDKRFKWDPLHWHVKKLRIESSYNIWVPEIETLRSMQQEQKFYSYFNDIEAKPDGRMSAELQFTSGTMCDTNFRDYPTDVNYCCFHLKSSVYPELLRFILHNGKGSLDKKYYQGLWDVAEIHSEIVTDSEDERAETLGICLTATRASRTLKLELTLPVVIIAVLVATAPLYGGFKYQHMVKLFTILLQFLCFAFLIRETPQLGFGGTVPKIYTFYQFSIAVTLASLLVTLLLDALSRVDRKLPPPHSLFLAGAAINSKMCCAEERTAQGTRIDQKK